MAKETRQILLQNGLEIMIRKGFNNTGIQEILVAAGVPKGSFYHFFKSKEDFGIKVLDYYGQQSKEYMTAVFHDPNRSPLACLRAFFEEGIKMMSCPENHRGCLIGNMTQEMGSLSPAFEVCLEKKWADVRGLLADCLRRAIAAEEICNSEDPDQLADFLVNSWQGAMMRMKVSQDPETLKSFVAIIFGTVLRPVSMAGV